MQQCEGSSQMKAQGILIKMISWRWCSVRQHGLGRLFKMYLVSIPVWCAIQTHIGIMYF